MINKDLKVGSSSRDDGILATVFYQ